MSWLQSAVADGWRDGGGGTPRSSDYPLGMAMTCPGWSPT